MAWSSPTSSISTHAVFFTLVLRGKQQIQRVIFSAWVRKKVSRIIIVFVSWIRFSSRFGSSSGNVLESCRKADLYKVARMYKKNTPCFIIVKRQVRRIFFRSVLFLGIREKRDKLNFSLVRVLVIRWAVFLRQNKYIMKNIQNHNFCWIKLLIHLVHVSKINY